MWHNECTDSSLRLEMRILLPIVIAKPALASCDVNFLACKSWCASLVNLGFTQQWNHMQPQTIGRRHPKSTKTLKTPGKSETGNEISKG